MPITYAIADLHGQLPTPPSDAEVLLIAGDICPDMPSARINPAAPSLVHAPTPVEQQAHWLDTKFRAWLGLLDGVEVAACWGNHDYVGEHPHLVPELPWTLLQDTETAIGGLRVYGTPWVPNLARWAFYASDAALEARADMIPEGLDVLMSHGPPHGLGDFVPHNQKYAEKYGTPLYGENVGDMALYWGIHRARPKVTICGHIHEARGDYEVIGKHHESPVRNVAAVDETYTLYPSPFVRLYEV